MAKKENLNTNNANGQLEVSVDELTSVTGGGSAGIKAANRSTLVVRYGQVTQMLQQDDVPNRDKLLQELNELQNALRK